MRQGRLPEVMQHNTTKRPEACADDDKTVLAMTVRCHGIYILIKETADLKPVQYSTDNELFFLISYLIKICIEY